MTAGIQRKAGRHEAAARGYAELDQRRDLERGLRLASVFDAGTNYLLMEDWPPAIERYSAFLALDPSPDAAATALVNRSGAYLRTGDAEHVLTDLGAVIDGAAMPPGQRAKALVARAEHRVHKGDTAGAEADADRVLHRSGRLTRWPALI